MNRRDFGKLVSAAVAGIVTGALLPGGMGGAQAEERHFKGLSTCQGLNDCKGKGGCATGDGGCIGKNSCKGKGGCAQINHVCKGHNICKHLGGCKTGDKGCKGKNTCRGKGGCAVPHQLHGMQPTGHLPTSFNGRGGHPTVHHSPTPKPFHSQ